MGPRAKSTASKKASTVGADGGIALEKTLSVTEIETLKDERAECAQALREAEGFGIGGPGEQIDKAKIKAQMDHYDREIEAATPKKMSSRNKDSLGREAKQLEEFFKTGMPTRYEMEKPHKNPGAVRKHMKWISEKEKPGYVERYREIQRINNPGEETSIETLRKEK